MDTSPDAFPTFRLFMRAYWNQMGPEVYGTLAAALDQFCSDADRTSEAQAHFAKLLLELREVRDRGFALKLDGIDSPEVWKFWKKAGGRGLGCDDFEMIETHLAERLTK